MHKIHLKTDILVPLSEIPSVSHTSYEKLVPLGFVVCQHPPLVTAVMPVKRLFLTQVFKFSLN